MTSLVHWGPVKRAAGLPIWLDYMRFALKDVPVAQPPAPPPGLNVVNGEYYFAEYPPGQAVARVGLPSPADALLGPGGGNIVNGMVDSIGDLLNQLGGSRDEAQPQRVPF